MNFAIRRSLKTRFLKSTIRNRNEELIEGNWNEFFLGICDGKDRIT
jgi:hypothetical protein